jgi:prepilin-type N-terminal cleavage/methylation domain-containing protein
MKLKSLEWNRRRRGFSLVEMLVALALTLMLMAIMSEMFVIGLDTFRVSKSVADMDRTLQTCADMIRRDLRSAHFEGSLRVSDVAPNHKTAAAARYAELGYFMVYEGRQGSSTSLREGSDDVGQVSDRDTNDFFSFTVRLDGTKEENFFAGRAPANLNSVGRPTNRHDNDVAYRSQWAELHYGLQPMLNADNTLAYTDAGQTVQLFNLYRRHKLLVPEFFTANTLFDPSTTNWSLTARPASVSSATFDSFDISGRRQGTTNTWLFNSPLDVSWIGNRYSFGVPTRRSTTFASQSTGANVTRQTAVPVFHAASVLTGTGNPSGLLASNVISFDIKVWDPQRNQFVDIGDGAGGQFGGNSTRVGNVTRNASDPGYYYDTWCTEVRQNQFFAGGTRVWEPFSMRIPNSIDPATGAAYVDADTGATFGEPMKAIQIRIRVWDSNTNQAREITIVEAL